MGLLGLLPNAITASRGLAGLLIAVLLLSGHNLIAFWLLILAVSTDMVDGYLARLLGCQSRMGLFLDALSDKVLADSVWVTLWLVDFAPWWLVLPMLLRDAIVVLGWLRSASRGVYLRPTPLGQITVAFESIALCVLTFHGPWLDVHWPSVGVALGSLALFLSTLSAVQYLTNSPPEPKRASA